MNRLGEEPDRKKMNRPKEEPNKNQIERENQPKFRQKDETKENQPINDEKRNQTPTERMGRPKEEPNQIQIKRMNQMKGKSNRIPTERERVKACGEEIPLALQFLIEEGSC